jgi:Collagen triple helix repeat (20 copies)
MLRRIRITPSMVIAILALVFAATGGAFAATGGGSAPHTTAAAAKSKAKTKAGPRGPAGPAGKNGATGPAGAQGPTGAAGTAGAKGETGASGTAGAQGEKGPAGPAGTTGAPGAIGPKGEPWTPNSTLPTNATETGAWAVQRNNATTFTSISFTVKLPAALDAAKVHVIKFHEGQGESSPSPAITAGECTGTVAAPGAASGNLCVFIFNFGGGVANIEAIANPATLTPGSGTTGAQLIFGEEIPGEEAKGQTGSGTWAVTG